MLEKPAIPDQRILDCLRDAYGLRAEQLTFLHIGADAGTAVYRAVAGAGSPCAYFVKLRKPLPGSNGFADISALLPRYLKDQGIQSVIAPLETRSGPLWASLEPYTVILYPYIDGEDGYTAAPSEAQWLEFGAVLRRIHAARLPAELAARIPREEYSSQWRYMARDFQARAAAQIFSDPTAAAMAGFMNAHRAVIDRVVARAVSLAAQLRAQPLEFVLCHADIHPGNLHLSPGGAFHLVDWDAPVYAPRERDLALVGGCARWSDPRDAALFYQGYGPVPINPMAVAYYRYERVIQDIAAYGQQLLESDAGGPDREQGYQYFTSSFLPGHEIALAFAADRALEVTRG